LAGNHGNTIGIAQEFDVVERFLPGSPALIHREERISHFVSIRVVRAENFRHARRQLVMKTNRRRVVLSERYRVFQIVEKQARLLWNEIERKSLDS
jgi:hypothetical protein